MNDIMKEFNYRNLWIISKSCESKINRKRNLCNVCN